MEEYSKQYMIAPFDNIISDLKLLGAEMDTLEKISNIQMQVNKNSSIKIHKNINDYKSLNNAILNIKKSIESGDYNDAITNANYLLEGLLYINRSLLFMEIFKISILFNCFISIFYSLCVFFMVDVVLWWRLFV